MREENPWFPARWHTDGQACETEEKPSSAGTVPASTMGPAKRKTTNVDLFAIGAMSLAKAHSTLFLGQCFTLRLADSRPFPPSALRQLVLEVDTIQESDEMGVCRMHKNFDCCFDRMQVDVNRNLPRVVKGRGSPTSIFSVE